MLQPKQLELRNFFHASIAEITVANAHRRFGKSTCLFAIAVEEAIKYPDRRIIYAAPTYTHVMDILDEINVTVFESCPSELLPKLRGRDNTFFFPNGSTIRMIGLENSKKIRGKGADLIIIDEAGFVSGLDNIVDSQLKPLLLTTQGKMIMISTPPESLSHPFTEEYIPKAKLEGSYWHLPITENPIYSPERVEKLADSYAAKNFTTGEVYESGWLAIPFRREFLCDIIGDTNRNIIPEWNLVKKDCVTPQSPPNYYFPIVAADFGFHDHTGVLFGWCNKRTNTLHVIREFWDNKLTPTDIAEKCLEIAAEVFPEYQTTEDLKEAIFWVADTVPLVTTEIRKQTGLSFRLAVKHNKEAHLTGVRAMIKQSRLHVDPACRELQFQLENGIWNKNKTSWERSDRMGHCDLIDALLYMARSAPWKLNPEPTVEPNLFDKQMPHRSITNGESWDDNFRRSLNE